MPNRPYAARLPPEERRVQLLDAALAVIAREGYRGVSVEAIAREAQVTRPVVYGAFPDLGALLGALLDRQERRALRQLAQVMPADPAAISDVGAFVRDGVGRLVDMVQADPLTWRPVLLAPEGTPGVVRERIARDRAVVRERIAGLVALAVGPAGDIDPHVAAHALLAVAEHMGRVLLDAPGALDRDALARTVAAVVTGLAPRSG